VIKQKELKSKKFTDIIKQENIQIK